MVGSEAHQLVTGAGVAAALTGQARMNLDGSLGIHHILVPGKSHSLLELALKLRTMLCTPGKVGDTEGSFCHL